MAVPKKRTGKSAQAKRRANWKATVPATTTCKSCGSIVLTHTVCPECGYYKKGIASIKNENYVNPDAAVKEKKAPAKKSSKKEAAEQTKAEEKVIEAVEIQEETEAKEAVKKAEKKPKVSKEIKTEGKVQVKTAEKMIQKEEKKPKKTEE